MDNKLNFDKLAWLKMIKNASVAYPMECCGFLLGKLEKGIPAVKMIIAVSNAAGREKYRHFLISSKNYIAAEKLADKYKLTLMGIYHSHPNQAPLPSISDIQFALPNFFYVILSVRQAEVTEVRCWQLDEEEQFREQYLEPVFLN